jgi:hypothetical protein
MEKQPGGWMLETFDGVTRYHNVRSWFIEVLSFDDCEALGLDGTLRDV